MQRKLKFTDVAVKNLKPQDGKAQTVFTDLITPGLRLRVSHTAKSWIFDYLVTGRKGRKTRTLGRYPTISLKQARDMASETYVAAQNGIDITERLQAEQLERKAEAERQAQRKSLGDVVRLYEVERLAHKRTGAEIGRCLHKQLAPWLDGPAEALTEEDLASCLTQPSVGRRRVVRAYLRGFTKWAKQRRHIPVNVGAELPVPEGQVQDRDRVLSIKEVRAIWAATGTELTGEYRDVVRMLLLTAQRRSIVTELTWGEVNLEGRCLDIAGDRTKNATASVTHLSPPALAILEQRWQGQAPTERVFKTPSFTRQKDKLVEATGIQDWRYHDFRHTFATNMAEREVPAEVVDLVLHHKMGSTLSKVARVYNRAALLPARACALDQWAELVKPTGGNVVKLHA